MNFKVVERLFCGRCGHDLQVSICACLQLGIMYPSSPPSTQDLKALRETALDNFHNEVKGARRRLAQQLKDYFDALERLSETEFLEIISELDGEGITISQMVEKHKRYIRTDKDEDTRNEKPTA